MMALCTVPGCGKRPGHSALHRAIAALLDACNELELEGCSEHADRYRAVAEDILLGEARDK